MKRVLKIHFLHIAQNSLPKNCLKDLAFSGKFESTRIQNHPILLDVPNLYSLFKSNPMLHFDDVNGV